MSTFHQCVRRVINPSLPLSKRHSSLIFALHKLAKLTYQGSNNDGDFDAFRRDQRNRYNLRFGFDDAASPLPEQLVGAISFAYAEYNKLRQVEQVMYRRRVSQKMRGWRRVSTTEQEAERAVWHHALEKYKVHL